MKNGNFMDGVLRKYVVLYFSQYCYRRLSVVSGDIFILPVLFISLLDSNHNFSNLILMTKNHVNNTDYSNFQNND